jgi:MOSC domain-containing protein YiiM
MTGSIVQINISRGGVRKYPVPEATVTPLGIEGDDHAHPNVHGGPDRALLIICAEAVDELAARGWPVFYGALGENLTVSGLDRQSIRAGQRYRAGEVFLELTRLRVPCSALDEYGRGLQSELYDQACKRGDVTSPRWGMGGFYARVLQSGSLRQGDIITLVDQVV